MMRKTLLGFLISLLVVLPVHAQVDADDTANALLDILALVPDTAKFRKMITSFTGYIDYRAVEEGRQTPVHPESFSEFEALNNEQRAIWFAAAGRMATGPPLFQYLRQAGGMSEAVGFDLFDVDHAMKYGQPPGDVTILSGAFNIDAIESALREEYKEHNFGGVSVWRRSDGKSDSSFSSKERNLANPFGGHLGRKQPIAILPARGGNCYIVSSTDWEAVKAFSLPSHTSF